MTSPISNHPHIEMVPRASLRPNPKNPRTHTGKQVQQMAAGIDRWGMHPIIIDASNMIVAGHLRWLAAGLLKLEELPVIRKQFVSEADARAFALFDNRIAELSGWDPAILQDELKFLFENDYDLDITGFSIGDLDFTIGDEPAKVGTELVELPGLDAQAVSHVGDLWHVGPHRLYCGNARAAESYEALMGEERAAMVFADPPYNVPINGHVLGPGKINRREFVEASGEMTSPEFVSFLRAVFRNCVLFSACGSIHYQCMDWRHSPEILDAANGIYDQFKQLVVWVKDNAGMGTFYRSQHELVFVFKSGKARHVNNFGLGDTGRYRTNVVKYAGANTFRKGRAKDLEDHPTIKPVMLVADFILDCSNRGDLVLDPFCGSGSSLLAAHRTGRRGAAIELDPLYVDTAIRRLRDATGLVAIHADGRSFDEIAADRVLGMVTGNG